MGWKDTNAYNVKAAVRELKDSPLNEPTVGYRLGNIFVGYWQGQDKVLFGLSDPILIDRFRANQRDYGLNHTGADRADCSVDKNSFEKDFGIVDIMPNTPNWPSRGVDPVVLEHLMINVQTFNEHQPGDNLRNRLKFALKEAIQNSGMRRITVKYDDEERYYELR